MDFVRNFPLFSIVLSLFSGVLCTMLDGKKAERYTTVYELFLIALNGAVLRYVLQTGESFTYVMGEFPAPWGNEIRAGVLEALLGLFFLLVLFCSVLAGRRFVRQDMDESKINLYYTLLNLLTAAMMALIWTNDVFTGYVFLEILTLTSCGILIVREIGRTTLAAVRYMILNLLGSGLFLLGVVLLYSLTGHLLMVPMRQEIALLAGNRESMVVLSLTLGILTIGLGIKSGLFPFHYWMPDTYGSATPTSAAVLSSLVSKCYIFLLFKIYWRAVGIDVFEQLPLKNILLVLGLCGFFFRGADRLHLYGDRPRRGRGVRRGAVPHAGAFRHQVDALPHYAPPCGDGRRPEHEVPESSGQREKESAGRLLFPGRRLFHDRHSRVRRLFIEAVLRNGSGLRRQCEEADPCDGGAGGELRSERPLFPENGDPHRDAGRRGDGRSGPAGKRVFPDELHSPHGDPDSHEPVAGTCFRGIYGPDPGRT